MVFRRRNKRTWPERVKAAVYPQGGWLRAGTYVWHRLTRLPDPPHRIARGIFAGVFISFTPLFGLHFFASALLAFLMRGNMVAAIFATFFGNPITFPIIAVSSVQLGHWMLGTGVDAVPARLILSAFASASGEIWQNIVAMFTDSPTQWGQLRHFYYGLFKPYLVGGIAPGLVTATICYYVSLPVILGYQKLRQKRRRDRAESIRERAAARLRARAQADDGASGSP
ncbi:DUF2062 domain-containing protein [Pseudorhodobacter sp. MZDSW-24AT]|uniref:DUF2062 domain-containing protein n=1 Tax=Pseudorhodobacter sp. MZDSW-24AT TaxID=2052957 RepID=UPI000C1E3D31|nr:DUF2062 domain-containing protein [Pseudorhodobacter sp. MZDSW-24AT]PJF09532.1 DUF2062 domain-containing protein [Pseudorhodobacter sp. MZDSW-24AT]